MFFYFLVIFLNFTREFNMYEILHWPYLLHSIRFIAKTQFFSRWKCNKSEDALLCDSYLTKSFQSVFNLLKNKSKRGLVSLFWPYNRFCDNFGCETNRVWHWRHWAQLKPAGDTSVPKSIFIQYLHASGF